MNKLCEYELLDGSVLLIEGEAPLDEMHRVSRNSDIVTASSIEFHDAVRSINSALSIMVAEFSQNRSDEMEINFGLKSSPKTGALVVSKGLDSSNFSITLKWKKNEDNSSI
jgi:hypothetical protein